MNHRNLLKTDGDAGLKAFAINAAHEERAQLLRRVAELNEDPSAAEAWLDKPLPGFGGQTPEDLLREGKGAWVHEYLDGLLAGVHA